MTIQLSQRPTMFTAGNNYSRADVLRALGQADPKGGAWYTGLVRHEEAHFIFCGVGVRGRTGHNYQNFFDGPDLVWHGRTGSTREHSSIRQLLSGGPVYVFFRDDDRAPFTYAGLARPIEVKATVPVEIRWSFLGDSGPHPEFLPEEIDSGAGVIEGAKRTVTVNVYERDPSARARCIKRWGARCIVCGFDFGVAYGPLGLGFVHVHHLRPLGEIGAEYVLDPESDLRPVCPNCHAMLHRTKPAMSIEQLVALRDLANSNHP